MRKRNSERGSVVILVALSTVALLGVAALSLDASFMFDLRDKMSAAADGAAKSAALEVKRGNVANYVTFAQNEVDRATGTGLLPAGVGMDAHLCTDAGATCTAPYNTSKYVEVILTKTHPTFFGNVLGFANLTPVARAVAGTSAPESCLVTMEDLSMKNADITLGNCAVKVGGNLTFENNPSHIAGPALVTGTCSGTQCTNVEVNQPVPENPFEDLVAPTVTGACPDATLVSITPGCYNNIPATTTTLQPGIYKITGTITSFSLTGTGVLLYLTSTAVISIPNGAHSLTLTASNSITGYEGIVIYGDPGSNINIQNNAYVSITGAVVMPGSDVTINNGLTFANTGCTIMVFKSWNQKAGNAQFTSDACDNLFANATYLSVALAE